MKITRYKKVQKYLKFYYNNFGFHQPYQVLIDGTFCFSASKEHINVREQLSKYLNGNIKLLTTRCIIIETEKIAKKTQGALIILKQFGIHECNHKEPVLGSHCIQSMVGKRNEKHYILATQDRDLQEKMRLKPGVPLLYLHNKSPTLEKPSKASYDAAGSTLDTNKFMFITKTQDDALKNMKMVLGVEEKVEEPKVTVKKKKIKNPNPLSCKKKKKPGDKPNTKPVEGRVRKRKKSKTKIIAEVVQ